jgi:hypothetical protein
MTATTSEFLALATYRKAIRNEVKRHTEEFREILTQALARHLELHGIELTVPRR